ncbi:MAG: hypothetical protein GTN80_08510 [Nitrososphaeria archaeon]|nr:hypothetical protein [Nitrososphaeria archaeon]NIQ33662.1 hypothetical protein [Nitrososphaeria archaeon]
MNAPGTHQTIIDRLRVKEKVVVLPDFFLDRIVRLGSQTEFFCLVREKAAAGGGVIHHIEQIEMKGGNAVNTAYALGRLGVTTTLITLADKYTEVFLRGTFDNLPSLDLRVKEGRPGYTVSLEFTRRSRLVNVMLGDTGGVSDFGPERLEREDRKIIEGADVTVVLNWAANLRGTELAEQVFSLSKNNRGMTYCDPSDITVRGDEYREFIERIIGQKLVDVLSVNENEARHIAKLQGIEPLKLNYSVSELVSSSKLLSEYIPTRIDLHTPLASCTAFNGEAQCAKAFQVEQRVATGAGDVWNAANIVGYLLDFGAERRLIFANAYAALFISSHYARPPSLTETLSFLDKRGMKML